MRAAFLTILGMLLLTPILALCWLCFDTTGLPDLDSLAVFSPKNNTQVSDPCLENYSPITAIPYERIGSNLRNALTVAEGGEMYPSILQSISGSKYSHARLPQMIAPTMLCDAQHSNIPFQLTMLRIEIQLEQKFSRRELFTIYANRLYLGEGQYGVEAASQHYLRKEPTELSLAEAALIAGIPKAPGRYSRRHPEAALKRRNEVINAMLAEHYVTEKDAADAKATALPITQ